MSDGHSDDWLSRWEQECSDLVTETEASLEAQTASERDANAQRLFLLFQTSATSVAQLYKECQNGVRLWTSFQNAASAVTTLYKECVELQKRQQELSVQYGVHRRNKDVLAWAHKRKRSIRREDLISFLSGRNPRMSPPSQGARSSSQWGSPRRYDVQRGFTRLSLGAGGTSAEGSVAGIAALGGAAAVVEDDDLGTFRQALALSAITVGAGAGGHHSSPRLSRTAELSHFISEEFARHGRKRSLPVTPLHHAPIASSVVTNSSVQGDDVLHHRSSGIEDDVIMGSPQHKRSKYM